IGAVDKEAIVLIEADTPAQHSRVEEFAANRLGDAVIRLYERYAELLPEGPARDRAAAAARAMEAFVGPLHIDRSDAVFARDLEFHDYRSMGLGSLSGEKALLDALRALVEMAADSANRVDDVFRLQSDRFLMRMTNFGTQRVGGGAYERPFLMLGILGADGLVARLEQFDIGQEAEAVARWDELVAAPSTVRPTSRRVRPNAVTVNAARLDAAMAARDVDALPTLVARDATVIEHTTGATYDAAGTLASRRALLRARQLSFRHEPLATLGDSLALLSLSLSADGVTGGQFDVGAYENE